MNSIIAVDKAEDIRNSQYYTLARFWKPLLETRGQEAYRWLVKFELLGEVHSQEVAIFSCHFPASSHTPKKAASKETRNYELSTPVILFELRT